MSQATETIAQLTDAGRVFMLLVGEQFFDFFDEGIVAGGGNYGDNMAWQAAEKMGTSKRAVAGVMSRLASRELGLWSLGYTDDEGQWWELTELGAAVANELAHPAPVVGTDEDRELGWSDSYNGRPQRYTARQNYMYADGYAACEDMSREIFGERS